MHAPHGSRPLLTEAELAAPGAVASPDRLVALRLEAPAAVPEKGDTGGRGGDAFSLHFDRATRHVVRIDPADVHRLRARVTDPAGVVVLELDGAHPEGVLAARPGTYRLEVLRNEDGRGTILTRCAVQTSAEPMLLRPGPPTGRAPVGSRGLAAVPVGDLRAPARVDRGGLGRSATLVGVSSRAARH